MTASSQNPPGALPPESPYDRPALRGPVPLQASVGAVTTLAQASPPAPVSPVQAAAAVISAEQGNGHTGARQLAEAERDAGLLFDPARIQAAIDAARAQERTALAAEMTQLREDSEALRWFRARWLAIGRLCEGRPLDYMVGVGEVLAAADGKTLTAPLTLSWGGFAALPQAGAADQRTVVECTTARGGRADLVLTGEERLTLASLLDTELRRDIHAPCPTSGCGTDHDLDTSGPHLFGWTRAQVAGTGEPARWYCTPMCASNALARAGAKLAEIDDQAALDGGL